MKSSAMRHIFLRLLWISGFGFWTLDLRHATLP